MASDASSSPNTARTSRSLRRVSAPADGRSDGPVTATARRTMPAPRRAGHACWARSSSGSGSAVGRDETAQQRQGVAAETRLETADRDR